MSVHEGNGGSLGIQQIRIEVVLKGPLLRMDKGRKVVMLVTTALKVLSVLKILSVFTELTWQE